MTTPRPHRPEVRADVSRETRLRLDELCRLIATWNLTIRLVGPTTVEELDRHICDSLSLVPLLGSASLIADVGSGAGFPGLVIGIAANRPIILVESDSRKAAFLREAVRATAAPATVLQSRFETLKTEFDLVTARALAPLTVLLDLVAPRLAPDGRCLFPKGASVATEVAAARKTWSFDLTTHSTAGGSTVLELSSLRRLSAG